jgi:hypothetical protein
MVARDEVLAALDAVGTYRAAAERLGIRPGLAYLVATGLPADGSAAIVESDRQRPGFVAGSTQHLANPAPVNPTVRPDVLEWARRRAARDLVPPAPSPGGDATTMEEA